MNEPIPSADAKKLMTFETAEFFKERARRADLESAFRILNRAGGEQPRTGDELPKGYKRRG